MTNNSLNVEFRHYRFSKYDLKKGWSVDNMGGFTLAYREENGEVYIGLAFCSPKENFYKAKGRSIAMSKLLNNPVKIREDQYPFIDLMKHTEAEDLHWFVESKIIPYLHEAVYGKDRYKTK